MNFPTAIEYLTASFALAPEFQNLTMAIQGAMTVRNGPNKEKKMAGFHAFCQGLVLAYGGGLLTPLWMGRPTPMLGNDLCFSFCLIAYSLVNFIPLDIGYSVLNTFAARVLTVMGAQLFRNRGLITFVNIAYEAFKGNPSKYYPTPVFGPILNAAILGNMGSFFLNGFHSHLQNGMPWAFQNGLFIATTYHFTANDKGPIGEFMREMISTYVPIDMDPVLLVTLMGSIFMQIVGILQMPDFFGPTFNPFKILLNPIIFASSAPKKQKKKVTVVAPAVEMTSQTKKPAPKKKNQKKRATKKKKLQ